MTYYSQSCLVIVGAFVCLALASAIGATITILAFVTCNNFIYSLGRPIGPTQLLWLWYCILAATRCARQSSQIAENLTSAYQRNLIFTLKTRHPETRSSSLKRSPPTTSMQQANLQNIEFVQFIWTVTIERTNESRQLRLQLQLRHCGLLWRAVWWTTSRLVQHHT